MRTRFKTLTIAAVLATAAMAGCSSTTTGSSGAVQDDVTASASSAASSTGSTAPAPSPDPVTPTAEPTEVPASPGASPTVSPPLLGGSSNPYCNTGLEYSCGDVGPGGGIVFLAVSTPFSLSNGYTTASCGNNNCQYMEAVPAWESPTAENPTGFQMPGPMAWCVGPGATTSVSPGTGAAIGTGYSNTQTMATKSGYCSSGAANTAIASTWGGLLRLVHTLTGRGNGAHGVFFHLSNDLQWQHLLDFLAVVREKRLDLQFRKTAKQHKGKQHQCFGRAQYGLFGEGVLANHLVISPLRVGVSRQG